MVINTYVGHVLERDGRYALDEIEPIAIGLPSDVTPSSSSLLQRCEMAVVVVAVVIVVVSMLG